MGENRKIKPESTATTAAIQAPINPRSHFGENRNSIKLKATRKIFTPTTTRIITSIMCRDRDAANQPDSARSSEQSVKKTNAR